MPVTQPLRLLAVAIFEQSSLGSVLLNEPMHSLAPGGFSDLLLGLWELTVVVSTALTTVKVVHAWTWDSFVSVSARGTWRVLLNKPCTLWCTSRLQLSELYWHCTIFHWNVFLRPALHQSHGSNVPKTVRGYCSSRTRHIAVSTTNIILANHAWNEQRFNWNRSYAKVQAAEPFPQYTESISTTI